MNKRFYLSYFFILLMTSSAYTQITITQTDLQAATAVGKTTVNHTDTLATSVNIGAPGSTSWNFSALQSHKSFTITYVNPATAPSANLFPTANVCQSFTQIDDGMPLNVHTFLQINNNSYGFVGAHMLMSIPPVLTQTIIITRSNPETSFQLPCTFGTTWSSTFSDTMKGSMNGTPTGTQYNTVTVTNTVDAYGPVTFPGGKTEQALRVKRDERKMTKFSPTGDATYSREVSYSILTAAGLSVEITPTDTNAANSGVIQLGENISWSTTGTTAVAPIKTDEKDFTLLQNYPNPFNPDTRISFTLLSAENITLSVYNAIGEKVATLAEGNYPAGKFEKVFNAAGLSSGLYFCVLNTPHYSARQKMLLMK